MKYSILLSASLLFHAFCCAQEARTNRLNQPFLDGAAAIRGEIEHSPGTQVGNLTVELIDPVRHASAGTALVSSGGDFDLNSVPFGMYTLRVLTMTGVVVTEKLIQVQDAVNTISVELPAAEGAKPGRGTVSLAQLMHRVPASALKDYNNALKAMRKKDRDTAVGLLEKAVAIDPQFVEAQTDLGRLYLQKHEPDKILAAFGAVLKIDPKSEVAYAGSSVANLWLNHFAAAEELARRALEINPASEASHYFLGVSLVAQDKDEGEAVKHLNHCSSLFPDARITAAEILARHKDFSAATDELQGYLKSGHPDRRDEVTSWLAELKRAQSSESAQK